MASTTPSSKGDLPTRAPEPSEKKMIDDILMLYQLKPSHQAYSHYSENAVFHDPVSIAKGLDSIKSQFNGMPKVFSESTTEKCDVLASSTPEKLQLNLTQRYVFKKPQSEKTVNSKLTFHKNAQGLITEHDEEWDHEASKTDEDGFMGKLNRMRKEMSAKVIDKTVSSNPDKI